jgi:hypothetical protein
MKTTASLRLFLRERQEVHISAGGGAEREE